MKILVVGGYGNFGKRLVHRLLKIENLGITIAGRSEEKAKTFCNATKKQFGLQIEYTILDVLQSDIEVIFREIKPEIVVNASGPYQTQLSREPYRVALACIATQCHYIDLADARQYVKGFSPLLHQKALDAKVMLVTGASTVPGLTTAVVDCFLPEFKCIKTIEYGITPGNKTERGFGTVYSILSYTGKSFLTLINGAWKSIYGWQDLERKNFGKPLGRRWMSNCEIPDLDLLPKRYPSLQTIRFKAGFEVTLLHCGLWFLSGISRIGLVKNWKNHTRSILRLSYLFIKFGCSNGGMYITLSGTDKNDCDKKIEWQLVAENGDGSNIPIISAELIVLRILKGNIVTGAIPCMGLYTLQEFFDIASQWNIYQEVL